MRIALYYPDLPDCDTCEKYLVDVEEWKLTIYQRTGEPVERPKNDPPPCYRCPKCTGCEFKNPDEGRKAELTEKNRRTLDLYYESQACGSPPARADEVLRKNLGMIHELITLHKRTQTERFIRMLALR